jgi:hypothetical protein
VVNIHCIFSTCTITAPRWKTKENNFIKDGNKELFMLDNHYLQYNCK